MKIIKTTIKLNFNTYPSSYTSKINTPTMTRCLLSVAIASSLLLVGCGDDNNDNTTNVTYATTVEPINSFTANDINNIISAGVAAPEAKCDIKIEKVTYQTEGSAGEITNATAALMLPSGGGADCQGDRPILLYAHGTTTDKNYDFSQVGNPSNPAVGEASLIAANFAAQGYIVVAPNYAGYDDSELSYHPYLVADQQSADMVDALDSARSIIDQQQSDSVTNVDDSGELFISGYSQGGHVAMATARLLESQNKPVTAIAPLSGPYALAAFGDAIFAGNVNIGATRFAPLLATGLQKKYGDIYTSPSEIFTDDYANTQLPSMLSFDQLVAAKQLPEFALFQRAPTNNPIIDGLTPSELPFAVIGFDDNKYLIKNVFRAAYLADAGQNPDRLLAKTGVLPAVTPRNGLRKALKDNDLRGYVPKMPTLLCGGHRDPTVFYDLNTGSMIAILRQANVDLEANLNITVLDVDNDSEAGRGIPTLLPISPSAVANPWLRNMTISNIQTSFTDTVNAVQTSAFTKAKLAGLTDAEAQQAAGAAFLASYHGGLVSTACTQATREFFEQNFNNLQPPV